MDDEPLALVARTRDLSEALPGCLESLDSAMRERWSSLRLSSDRDDFLAARVLAADAVRALLGVSDPIVFAQCCEVCGGPHGRPVVVSHAASVSWSHSHGVVAAAARKSGRVGIDVEQIYPDELADGLTVTGRTLVRGEALVKVGVLTLDDVLASSFDWPVGADGAVHGCRVRDLTVDLPGFFCAVAMDA